MRYITTAANRFLSNQAKKRLKFLRARLFERCGSERYSRPALYQMEEALLRHLDGRPGYFVECGANDGYTQSNTYYLSRYRQWKGLLIEPIPMLYELCRSFRPESTVVNCALGAVDGCRSTMVYSDLMSTTIGARSSTEADLAFASQNAAFVAREGCFQVEVPVRTLSSILDDVGVNHVDLFVLDVEGFELQVLSGIDFDRHHISYVLVESNDPAAVTQRLAPHFEFVTSLSHHDMLFRHIAVANGESSGRDLSVVAAPRAAVHQ
jgi:FkbM family methyltransferase